ncbi:hypothetical protein AO398_23695 [Methylobacterium sp. GXS13]|uniref:DEAD/DEAH box helicase n=1 Tax=Methylobacterium sp. GXS13 TaxID=1730094 RepID=UPI00071BF51A|nr:DEAD/DEAH box helicase [Methylobacterium sp. GXS13]KST57978.1 hypothetical protein AO398_23695 [Methylobacterium sp. GXS13]
MEISLIRECLAEPARLAEVRFPVFREIAYLANHERTAALARDLVIRLLAVKHTLPKDYGALLDALVREVGLFPYADRTLHRSLEDQILIEAHRVHGVGEERFFHSLQLSVFQELAAGRNVVLSAPTSVGKSLVVDAVLATGQHRRAVIVVPTIALIDETRRRITASLGRTHDVITHPGQARREDGRPTVYVLTQERALGRDDLDDADFLVIDEFYKLDMRDGDDDERSIDLNVCFHRLAEKGAQFYLIGPSIASVAGLATGYRHVFIPSDFSTVSLDITYFGLKQDSSDRAAKLVELCRELTSPTLVYCQSPRSARDAARNIYLGCELPVCEATADAVRWLERHYPPEWEVIRALARGVGVHHGNVPRAIQQYMVRAFEEGSIRYLVCTSTIIEGVNTVAENVIVFDRRRNTRTIDDFTFRNIAGRAGRMNRYFIGKVFVIEEAVAEGDHTVDLPIGAQDGATPLSLLLALPTGSLTPGSRDRLAEVFRGSRLAEATIRANRYVPVGAQNALADAVSDLFDRDPRLLQWRGVPDSAQFRAVCDLIYDHVDQGTVLRRHGIHAGDQLQAVLTSLMAAGDFGAFIARRVQERWRGTSVSEAVEGALSFLRKYVGFTFGRQLMAVSRIQADVLARRKRGAPGDYALLAARADSLFLPAGVFALDEYGIPAEIASKLMAAWGEVADVDEGLRMLAALDLERLDLQPFEREVIRHVRKSLPSRAYEA